MKKNFKTVNEVLIGKSLDDNKWHTIVMLRVTRMFNVRLHGYGERVNLIPGLTTDLHLNKVIYVGGVERGFAQNEAKPVDSRDQEENFIPFKGCLKNLMVDNKRPLVELDRRSKNLAIHGIVSKPCHASEFNPIHFPNPQSVVDVVRVPSSSVEREVNIRLQFRTFDSEGTVLYAEGKRCHFILGIQKQQVRF